MVMDGLTKEQKSLVVKYLKRNMKKNPLVKEVYQKDDK
jgi:hypothetical protein